MFKTRGKTLFIVTIIAGITVSFIVLYAGHFLFFGSEKNTGAKPAAKVAQETKKPDFPVKYEHLSIEFGGNRQEINLLEVNVGDPRVELKPVLSFDSVFGFEKLSVMVKRVKAYAAVNSGFFSEYGEPSGMVAIDGKLITAPTGKYPVFRISNGMAKLEEIKLKFYLKSMNGKVINIHNMNTPGKPDRIILYTPEFGSGNRAKSRNVTVAIKDSKVISIASYPAQTEMPQNGMLLTYYGLNDAASVPLKQGDAVELISEPAIKKGCQAYECGSWLVREGKNVARESDPWVGVMTNYDPRTAVGIKKDGTVVLVTVDGRQPGYSVGLTGKELGDFLLSQSVENAAMLDGGASTEMIVQGKVVNRPSFKGQERPLGGGLAVIVGAER